VATAGTPRAAKAAGLAAKADAEAMVARTTDLRSISFFCVVAP